MCVVYFTKHNMIIIHILVTYIKYISVECDTILHEIEKHLNRVKQAPSLYVHTVCNTCTHAHVYVRVRTYSV